MRCVTVPCFTAPGVKAWVADKNCVLVGTYITAGRVAVTENPASTDLNVAPVAADGVRYDILCFNDRSTQFQGLQLKIPLVEGRTYYLQNSSSAWVLLFLEDVAETIAT